MTRMKLSAVLGTAALVLSIIGLLWIVTMSLQVGISSSDCNETGDAPGAR